MRRAFYYTTNYLPHSRYPSDLLFTTLRMNDIDMLYERSTPLSEERRVPEDRPHSASASLHLPPTSTTSTTTSVPANQYQDLPLLLEHAQWAVASSTTFTIILAFILQLVALWIRSQFTGTGTRLLVAYLDSARSASSESPATSSSSISPMCFEPSAQDWDDLISSRRSGTLPVLQGESRYRGAEYLSKSPKLRWEILFRGESLHPTYH